MESYSEILKKVHICTESCDHLEPVLEVKLPKVRAKTIENCDKDPEDYSITSNEYYGCSESNKTKKIRKPGPAKIQTIIYNKLEKLDKLTNPRASLLEDQEYNISNSVPIDKTLSSQMTFKKSTKNNPTAGRVWIYAHKYPKMHQGNRSYFERAKNYLDDFTKKSENGGKVFHLFWNHECYEVELHQMQLLYKDTRCYNHYNVAPSSITKWIHRNELQNKKINLWIITSCEMDQELVYAEKSLNYGINFESLTVVNMSNKKIDNSIAFAFMSPDCHQINLYEESAEGQEKISVRKNYFNKIKYSNFQKEYDNLVNYAICMYSINYKDLDLNEAKKQEIKKEIDSFVNYLEAKKIKMVSTYHELHKENSKEKEKDDDETLDKKIAAKIDSIIDFIHKPKKNLFSISEMKEQIIKST